MSEFLNEFARMKKGDILSEELKKAVATQRTQGVKSFEEVGGAVATYSQVAAADLPPTPSWNEAWQVGEPDLVVTLPPYTVPAAGSDRYRNLVASIPVDETRYVSTVELRWGDTRVVHHARMMVDTTASSRLFDESDPQPGFDGMDIVSGADNPPGHFVGWAPGRVQVRGATDIAWPLGPGTDLVLQLHLRPTGRPELVRPQVGFYFTDRPPTKTTALIALGSLDALSIGFL